MAELIAPWATATDACGPCTGDETGIDPDQLAAKMLLASEILFAVTGYQWPGVRTETWRPPGVGCVCPRGARRDDWPRAGSFVSEVQLPGYPVVDVVEVTIDGAPVDADAYRVDDSRYLVWQGDDPDSFGGRNGWPCCQRMKLELGEPDTWGVEYSWGALPPGGGVGAAAALGCEFALACGTEAQRKACRLPRRVATITRQGVSIGVLDKLELFAEGRTGIGEVDLWVGSLLLGRERRRASVIDTQAWALGRRGRRGPDAAGS